MHPFFCYTETMSIPVLDLELSYRKNEIDNLNNACEKIMDFFPSQIMAIMMIFLMRYIHYLKIFLIFLNLSKNKYSRPENGGARGYTPFGKETALGEKLLILKNFGIMDPKSINI